MLESYLRKSPLAHLGLEGRARETRGDAGVALAEKTFRGIVDLRGSGREKGFTPAFRKAFGFALPTQANTTAGDAAATAFWLGPDQWWIVTPGDGAATAERLRQAVGGFHSAVTDISESRTCLQVAGPAARDLLAKGCPLDLHPRIFANGGCAQSHIAKAGVLIHQVDAAPVYDLYVLRSFAEYLWLWLEDAAGEYGVAVLHGA